MKSALLSVLALGLLGLALVRFGASGRSSERAEFVPAEASAQETGQAAKSLARAELAGADEVEALAGPRRELPEPARAETPAEPEAYVDVVVLDAHSMAPLADIALELYPADLDPERRRAPRFEPPRSDSAGRASLVVRPDTAYVLVATTVFLRPGSTELRVGPLARERRTSVRLLIETDYSQHVFGRVLAAETGEPLGGVEGVRVRVTDPGTRLGAQGVDLGKASYFELEPAVSGYFDLWTTRPRRGTFAYAYGPGRARRYFWLGAETFVDRPLEVRLPRAAWLAVQVLTPSRRPAAGVEVRLEPLPGWWSEWSQAPYPEKTWRPKRPSWKARTDFDGVVRFEDCPGRMALSVQVHRADGSLAGELPDDLTLAPGAREEIEIVLFEEP